VTGWPGEFWVQWHAPQVTLGSAAAAGSVCAVAMIALGVAPVCFGVCESEEKKGAQGPTLIYAQLTKQ
jgi:hypothetical protein